jgi:hypothetical protein
MKPFSWSWSKLKNFRVCPKRTYHVDIAKDYKEEESEQLAWGDRVHKAMAATIGKGQPLPEVMQHYAKWPNQLRAWQEAGMTVLVEQKLAMTKDFKPAPFFDNIAWYRGVADALALAQTVAFAFDWKTGAIKPDYEQLALTAQLIFVHYPHIQTVGTDFVWLGHDDETGNRYEPGDMIKVWNNLWPEINQMEEAARTMTYPPKPSGLCINYCPVTSCPYHGKGTR